MRRKRDTQRAKRQFDMEEFEAAAEERNTVSRAENSTSKRATEEEAEATGSAATGSAYNPENPYHVSTENSVHFKEELFSSSFDFILAPQVSFVRYFTEW